MIELLLGMLCLFGAAAVVTGWLLRGRRIRYEHWLWKKQRLRRAKLLLRGGGAATLLGVAGLLII